MLAFLREGDVVVVTKLDRLGRSMKNLIELMQDFSDRGVGFRSLSDGIDTTTPAGRFLFHILAALSEMERELIIERTRAGLSAARARGRVGGRPPKMTKAKKEAAMKLKESGASMKDIAQALDMSLSSIYRHLGAAG